MRFQNSWRKDLLEEKKPQQNEIEEVVCEFLDNNLIVNFDLVTCFCRMY